MTWIFTFGFGQTDPRTGRTLSNCFVEVPIDDDVPLAAALATTKANMVERFGHRYPGKAVGNWAFDYPTREAAGVDRYGMTEIDFDTGQDVR